MEKQRGITLIALIITIIVMLILVGVTVSFTIGENGILSQAKQAKIDQDKETEKEQLIIEAYATYGKEAKFNPAKFKVAIEEKGYTFEEARGEITTPKGNMFIIDEEDKITEKEIIENDILISTVEEWNNFANAINAGSGKEYERYQGKVIGLKNDIDFAGEEFKPVGTLNPSNFTGVAFEGMFNGQGNSLKNIEYTNAEGIATVFVNLNNATITDLKVEDGKFSGIIATGICGYTTGDIIIQNCINSNDCIGVSGAGGIGAITQDIYGLTNAIGNITIKNCHNLGKVELDDAQAGLVCGITATAKNVSYCSNTGNLSNHGGEICGIAFYVEEISNCYNSGEITVPDGSTVTAGIVGKAKKVTNCYNTGTIHISCVDHLSGEGIGGIVAINLSNNQPTEITNCYNIGTITCGRKEDDIGDIYGACHRHLDRSLVTVKNCYALDIASRDTEHDCTAEELKNANLGSAFKEDTENINNGYPILTWQ